MTQHLLSNVCPEIEIDEQPAWYRVSLVLPDCECPKCRRFGRCHLVFMCQHPPTVECADCGGNLDWALRRDDVLYASRVIDDIDRFVQEARIA